MIYTGAPPIAEQLRGQVRSNTGMTWGIDVGGVAKIAPLSAAPRAAVPPPPKLDPLTAAQNDLLRWLMDLDFNRGVLPRRPEILQQFSWTYMRNLQALNDHGCLTLWRQGESSNGWWAVRLKGSERILATPDSPTIDKIAVRRPV